MRPKIKNSSVDGGSSYQLGVTSGSFFAWHDNREGVHRMLDEVMDKLDEHAASQS